MHLGETGIMSEKKSGKALVKSEEKDAEVLDRDKLMSATQELTDTYDDNDIEDVKEQKMVRAVAKVMQSEFSGPIPPPNMIKGYEAILPGAADRIITMAEKQSSHRQEMERKIIFAESRDSLLGILFAFFLGIGYIVAAIVIVVLVPENPGAISSSVLGVAGMGTIIGTFIKSTRTNNSEDKKERKDKKDKND